MKMSLKTEVQHHLPHSATVSYSRQNRAKTDVHVKQLNKLGVKHNTRMVANTKF